MKILKLPAYYFPEQISSTHLSNDLGEAYFKAGYEFTVFAPTPSRGISKEERDKYKKIKYEERMNGTVKVHRFPMFAEPKNALLRAIRYTLIQMKQYRMAIKEKDIDVIASGSTPPTAGLLCTKIKKKLSKKYGKNIPFIFNLQDVFPDSLVNSGLCGKNSIIYKIGDKIAKYTYNSADKIIVISEDFKKMLLDKGIPEEKIELIYNWVDENAVVSVPREENPLFDRYGLDRDKFYISYSGNIGASQNFDMLLEVAEQLKEEKHIGFVIVGEGIYKKQIETAIEQKQLDNVTLLPFQPYEEISYVFSLGDVGLLISKKGIGGSSVPSKTWSYMSAKRPVLASFDIDSELCDIIRKNNCGVCVDAGDAAGLKAKILELAHSELKDYGENGRRFVIEHVSKETCTAQYVKLYSQICI